MRRLVHVSLVCCFIIMVVLVSGVWAAQPIPGEFSQNINWKQFSGQTIDVLFSIHPWQEAIEPLIPQFEKLTGIEVRVTKLPEQEFLTKVPADMTAGIFGFDVFMSQYYDAPKYTLEKWTEPLDDYLTNPALTDAKWYDWQDFFPGARAVATVGASYKDRIPITAEAQVLVYRKDIFDQLGLNVPDTFDELLDAAKTIQQKTKLYGITIRGGQDLWWPMYGVVRSYGGDYMTIKDFKSHINSPGSKAGVEMYLKLLQYTPPGVTSFGWDEINTAMITGRAAMVLDSSVIYSRLEDPKRSTVAGKIGIAPFPKGPVGRIAHSHYWSISLNPKSKKKAAGWLFIEWATSKQIQLQLALKGVLAPRSSVWGDPGFAKTFPKDFVDSVATTLKTAVISPANMRFFEMMDVVRAEVQEAFSTKKAPDLASVDKAWQKMLAEIKASK
ncbi:MAG: sugar ABC transporter substrate-binding protein [Firmicutes bacterium]|nr:sugar ABC transporter substrate-binding protein [Bacillota bacterium]